MTYVKLITSTPNAPHPVDKLLDYIFADKRSVYVDDVILNADGSFEVSWCRQYTLYMGDPAWMDTHIDRDQLITFITVEKLNYWESFRYDHQTGSVQPFSTVTHDLETFLDENFRDVITEYMNQMLTAEEEAFVSLPKYDVESIKPINSTSQTKTLN